MARATMRSKTRGIFVALASRIGFSYTLLALLPFFSVGCGQTEVKSDSALTATDASSGSPEASDDACETGAVRDCYLTLANDGDSLECYEGTERCVDGDWGECTSGSTVDVPIVNGLEISSFGALSLSSATECVGNPCNPYCRRFLEVPSTPVQASQGAQSGFLNGDPDSVPAQSGCAGGKYCQDDQYCSEPITASACAHSKCVTGTALSSSCRSADTCVDAICTLYPSCCSSSGSWTAACVNKVKTVCDSFCGTSTTPACSHHVCTTGAGLTCSNTCVNLVCASTPSCCSSSWGSTCVDTAKTLCGSAVTVTPPAVPAYSGLCGYALYAYNNLELGQKAKVSGTVGAGGNLTITQATVTNANLQVTGKLIVDSATITGTATVQGNVYLKNPVTFSNTSGPVLTVGGKTYVAVNSTRLTGTVVSNSAPVYGDEYSSSGTLVTSPTWVGTRTAPTSTVTVSRPTIPTKTGLSCSSSLPSYTVNTGGTLALDPGNYGSVTVNGSTSTPTVLSLKEGTYTFYNLTLNAGSRVALTYGTTGIDINVCNSMSLGNYLKFSPLPSPFTLLRWYYAGTTATNIDLQGGTDATLAFPGMLVAPSAKVTVAPNTGIQGVVYASELKVEPGLVSLASDYATTMCGSTSAPYCNPAIDMTANPVVSESGTCVDWDVGKTDSSCSSYDLSLGVPCENSIVVCNHGTQAAPANVRLALFKTTYSWANTSPNLTDSAHVGDCYTTSTIPAGQCINQLCDSTLFTSDLEIVAIPPTSTPAECSTLENWAHYYTSTECACFWGELTSADIVAGTASTCGVSLGDTSLLDLSDVEVTYYDASGTSSTLTKRSGSTDCSGGGWYLDGSTVVLCSSTCSAVDASTSARAKIRVGCPPTLSANVISEVYESDCEDGQLAQWNLLNWTSSTPADSKIRIEVRSARDTASLGSATFQEIGVARNDGTGDTQVCDAFNTSGECPAMFYSLVEDGVWEMSDLREPVIELRATLQPSTSSPLQSPVLSAWDVQFSCLDSE